MKVLITGATGFIGSRIADYFYNNGYDVVGWDRKSRDKEFIIKNVDMENEDSIVSELQHIAPDIVIHCAGSADVSKSVENPRLDFVGNVIITHNLLFAIHKCKLKKTRIVFLSSASVYGNPTSLPITEDMPLNPLSPYAVHKVMCEELCKYFIANYNMDIKIARIFSAYGVGLTKQIFWDMYQKYKSTGRLDMIGTGKESRDYINVNDVVRALYMLATENSNEFVYNVANGEEVTIREVVELFALFYDVDLQYISFNGIVREGDPLNWKADISKIRRLGYEKSIDIRNGIKQYTNWIKQIEKGDCYGH